MIIRTTKIDNALNAKANQLTTYTKTEVDGLGAATTPSITTTTSRTLNNITTNHCFMRFIMPPPGNIDLQLQAHTLNFGKPAFMTATITTIIMWTLKTFNQSLQVRKWVIDLCLFSDKS